MRVLCDTSTLIAGSVQSHPQHTAAVSWLKRAKSGKVTLTVATHSLAECYAVLTKLPLVPKISPTNARSLIKQNIEGVAKIVSLSSADYLSTIQDLMELGLSGGIIYDALILKAAKKANVQKLLTLNVRDYIRLCPNNPSFIISP